MHLLSDNVLEGRRAVVTGASSGIGEGTAERLAALGASVAVAARREDRLTGLVDRITEAGGTAISVPLDVRDRLAVQDAAGTIIDRFGGVDLVVNNAGVQHVSPITALQVDDWQHQIDLNVTGFTNVIGAFVKPLVDAAGQGRQANLVQISSVAAVRGLENFQVYSGTKGYVAQVSRALHLELGPLGVRVNIVEPGMVDTELPDHVDDADALRMMADLVESGVTLQSADIAELVAFVAAMPAHASLPEALVLPTAQAI